MRKFVEKYWRKKNQKQKKELLLKMPIYLAIAAGLMLLGALIPWFVSLIIFLILLLGVLGVIGGYLLKSYDDQQDKNK